jgi:hypothetical protein
MFVPFASISPESRIWIFQAERAMSSKELQLVEEKLRAFTNSWAAHGEALKTSFTVKFNQFIVLAADESHQSPSGCSIDSSFRVLKEIEREIAIQLFDRNLVAFIAGDQVMVVPLRDLRQKFGDGTLKSDSLSFNNLITTKAELSEQWVVPASKTWLRRYIPDELVKFK